MGRPRLYADAAAKHRAYRARSAAETVRVDRRRLAALEARVSRLGDAFGQAWAAGCEVAREVREPAPNKVLDSLTALDLLAAWFEERIALATDVAPSGATGRPHSRKKEGSPTQK